METEMSRPVEETLPLALEYRDGKLFWREGWPTNRTGQEAGYLETKSDTANGYVRVYHRGRLYQAHRIVWLLHHGKWPDGEVDHIDGCHNNNRIENLRDVSPRENMYNRPMYKCNSTGYKGVYLLKSGRHAGRISATISKDKKPYWLGYFRTKEDAARAYDRKAIELHGEHARTNFPIEDYA